MEICSTRFCCNCNGNLQNRYNPSNPIGVPLSKSRPPSMYMHEVLQCLEGCQLSTCYPRPSVVSMALAHSSIIKKIVNVYFVYLIHEYDKKIKIFCD